MKHEQIRLSQFTNDNSLIFIKRVRFSPPNFPLHSHNFFEIELVTNGYGRQSINGNKYVMQPGLLYFLAPTDSHYFTIKKELEIFNISIDYSLIPEPFTRLLANKEKELVFYLENENLTIITQLFTNIYNEYLNKQRYSETIINDYLSIILSLILRMADIEIFEEKKNNPIFEVISYIKLHFIQNPKLETLAKHFYLNPSYLSSSIKKALNMSYTDYLTNLKLSQAKRLLKHTSTHITAIAFSSGFTSISNFNRIFKKKIGISPSLYRKKHRNNNEIDPE